MSKKQDRKASTKNTNKSNASKPAPAAKPAVVQTELPEAPETSTADDADDDDDAPAAAAVGPDGKKIKATWLQDKIARVARNVKRSRSFAGLVLGNFAAAKIDEEHAKELADGIAAASAYVEGAMKELLSVLPADFKGVSAPGGSVARVTTGDRKPMLAVGAAVRFKESKGKEYAELFSADEIASLRVIGSKGKMVVMQTVSGSRLMMPAKDLEAIEATTTDVAASA